jgi:hypothetical protein
VSQLGSLRRPRAEEARGCRLPRARCLPVSYGRWNGGLPEPRISRRFAHADRPTSGCGDRPVGRAVGFDVHVICFWPSRKEPISAGPAPCGRLQCGVGPICYSVCCRIARVPVDLDGSVPMYVFLCKK